MDPLDDAFSVMRVRESLYARGQRPCAMGNAGQGRQGGKVRARGCGHAGSPRTTRAIGATRDRRLLRDLDGSTYTLGDYPRSPARIASMWSQSLSTAPSASAAAVPWRRS